MFRCTEKQRRKELEKEKCHTTQQEDEGKRLILKEENEGKRLAVEQEKQKRITLHVQLQHDQKEAEKRRFHEIELENKKAETAEKLKSIELKVQEQYTKQKELEAEMLEERNRHEADMHDKRGEEILRLQLEIQEQRTEEKRLNLEYLQIRLEESGKV